MYLRSRTIIELLEELKYNTKNQVRTIMSNNNGQAYVKKHDSDLCLDSNRTFI
jgi:hypothetical protein